MKINIVKKEKNSLLRREEIYFNIEDVSATPSRIEVLNKLSSLLAADRENIVIKRIENEFGVSNAKGLAYLYDSKEILKALEPEYIIKRSREPEKEKKEEKNATKEQA